MSEPSAFPGDHPLSEDQARALGFRPVESRRDIVIACMLLAFYAAQVLWMVFEHCPFWSFCFPLVSIGPYFWIAVAVAVGFSSVRRIRSGARLSCVRVVRTILAVVLALCIADILTAGDHRWFELGMRRELRNLGGATALQTWAQNTLESPEILANWDEKNMVATDLPPQFRTFASQFRPLYRRVETGGPFFMFDDGGWDMGWGLIVGKADLCNPSPVNAGPGEQRGWTKQVAPGVYLYAF